MDGYLGEIKMFAGTYAPAGWEYCWGQILEIAQYQSLYALLGVQFGGNGTSTFGLPDLRGRVPVGAGTGPGLTPRIPGQMGGAERITLVTQELPQHTHYVQCDVTSGDRDLSADPQGKLPAKLSGSKGYGTNVTGNPKMHVNMITENGNGQSHENMPPWQCLNYIICVEGNWPPRS
jgi:microcystin-dependent protein